MRSASALRGQRADDLPVGCRAAIDIHDRKEIVRPLVDVPVPDEEVGAATGLPGPLHRRTGERRQEEQANRMPASGPQSINPGVEGKWAHLIPHS